MTPQPQTAHPYALRARAFAWAIHGYTACGALLAFAMTIAVIHGRPRLVFLLMVVATVIDATDGALARIARVKDAVPSFDGARLDDIVDYLTFVFVPALLLFQAGLLPSGWESVVAAAILMSSAYGFSANDAKTDDHFFTGFPSYWNIAALYLYAAHLRPVVNGIVLLVLSAMVFVRIRYIYPSRTPILRGLTIALCVTWSVLVVQMILMLPDVPLPLLLMSLFFPLYYVVLSLVLHGRRARRL
ncbi:MAG: CDP-alcohol phosphatidyltransferase family protein [Vicinamibacterales bacterium]